MEPRSCYKLLIAHRAMELNAKYTDVCVANAPIEWWTDFYLRPRLDYVPWLPPRWETAKLLVLPVSHHYGRRPYRYYADGHATAMAFDRTKKVAVLFDSSGEYGMPDAMVRDAIKTLCGDTVDKIQRRIDHVQRKPNCVMWMLWAMGGFAARGVKLGRALSGDVDELEAEYRRRVQIRVRDGHTLMAIDENPCIAIQDRFQHIPVGYDQMFYEPTPILVRH
jgi:hypothetical protein